MGPDSYDHQISLKAVAHGEDRIKVTWFADVGKHPSFELHRRQVESVVKGCREALEALTDEFMGTLNPSFGPALRRLAEEGSRLHYLLFDGVATQREEARKILDWLNGLEGSVRLTISADSAVHIPWTLVYHGDPQDISDDATSVEDYNAFWALRYVLSVVYTGMTPRVLNKPRKRDTFKVLSVLSRAEYEQACTALTDDESAFLDELLERPVGKTFSWPACRQRWNETSTTDCLFHVFAHASGTGIQLSPDENLDVVDFKRFFSRKATATPGEGRYCVVFLNGCSTAVGDLDNAFINATAEPGFCGFIGAEAPLPVEFAIRFGAAFMYLLLERGLTVVSAIDRLRRQHWPLGLIYGCFAHPSFHVERCAGTRKPPWTPDANFSFPRLDGA
ncbi:MAG: hypothetical protein O7D91_04070 [Planctomycetota bacterium]|nr:hypothetical protein [Planctomycetota bacterium]